MKKLTNTKKEQVKVMQNHYGLIEKLLKKKINSWELEFDRQTSNMTKVILFEVLSGIVELSNNLIEFDALVNKLKVNDKTFKYVDKKDINVSTRFAVLEFVKMLTYTKYKHSDIDVSKVLFYNNTSIFVNGLITDDWKVPKKAPVINTYLRYINKTKKTEFKYSDGMVIYYGLYNTEIDMINSPKNAIVYNKITDDIIYIVANYILEKMGLELFFSDDKDMTEELSLVSKFLEFGKKEENINKFFTNPIKYFELLETFKFDNKDLLHYVENYLMFKDRYKMIVIDALKDGKEDIADEIVNETLAYELKNKGGKKVKEAYRNKILKKYKFNNTNINLLKDYIDIALSNKARINKFKKALSTNFQTK